MSDQPITISPAPDGPLLVNGKLPLAGPHGPLETPEKFALCRCGASANKPFCDGAHKAAGFTGAKAADRTPDGVKSYAGAQVTIHDNRGACAHAGICTDKLPGVWRYKQEPWIVPDGGTVAEIIGIVLACPSGALSYTLKDAEPPAEAESAPGVTVVPRGPYAVHGDVKLEGAEFGERTHPTRYTLCRCGHSKNKPFCDGAHWNVEFDV